MQRCYSNGFKSGANIASRCSDGGDFSKEYEEVEKLIDLYLKSKNE